MKSISLFGATFVGKKSRNLVFGFEKSYLAAPWLYLDLGEDAVEDTSCQT